MIINCTPHDVWIYTPSDCYMCDGLLYLVECEKGLPQPLLTYPAAKEPARVTFLQKPAGMVDGVLIFRWIPDEIVNLPESKSGTYYIVPKMVAQAYPERKDLIFPGTVVRGIPEGSRWMSAEDHVVGCIDFSRV